MKKQKIEKIRSLISGETKGRAGRAFILNNGKPENKNFDREFDPDIDSCWDFISARKKQ